MKLVLYVSILFKVLFGFGQVVAQAIIDTSRPSKISHNANNKMPVRGYYIIPTRTPTWNLDQWKISMDCFAEDSANTIIFWIAGGFRSVRYPVTWQYNKEHLNIQKDFVKILIDYAHIKGIKILLGFTPFAYDGVNQYAFEHPETRGKNIDGSPINEGGIFSFGYSLCPAVEESQKFMVDYIEEMVDDFYPNADGLFIESSDYGRCHCKSCHDNYFENEFRFVRAISDYFWNKKPDATIVVYPHYFVSGKINTSNVQGVGGKQNFDRRWTLFFTPHSADPTSAQNRELMAKSSKNLYWDTAPIWGNPSQIRDGARTARNLGADYFPTIEGYSYKAKHVEFDGEQFIVDKQLKPFGFDWLPVEKNHYRDPLVRLNRLAYREFSKNPDLELTDFKKNVQKEMFRDLKKSEAVDDLFYLVDIIVADRQGSFFFASPIVNPTRLFAKAKAENWPQGRIDEYRTKVKQLTTLAEKYRESKNPVEHKMGQIASYITKQWAGK